MSFNGSVAVLLPGSLRRAGHDQSRDRLTLQGGRPVEHRYAVVGLANSSPTVVDGSPFVASTANICSVKNASSARRL